MSQLSEKQLLLLDNLMYCDVATSGIHPTVGDLVNSLLANPEKAGKITGSSDKETLNKILIDISKDSTLMSLQMGDTHKDNGTSTEAWSATCFVDPVTKEATIAFRGTGGTYEAWYDNLEGAGDSKLSPMQQSVCNWVKDLPYPNITVTGHSKGGNLAQVATVLCPDKVKRCISYDGQGFSEAFLNKYADEIAVARNRIKSISAYNDYVNVAMFSIAGEEIFVNNSRRMFPGGHYAENLLWDNEFDKDGNFTSVRKQGYIAKGLSMFNKTLLKLLPESMEEVASDAVGVVVGYLFDKNSKSAKQALSQLIRSLESYLVNMSALDLFQLGYLVGALIVSAVVSVIAIELNMMIDGVLALVEYIKDRIVEAGKVVLNWASEHIEKFVSSVNGFIDIIKEHFNIGGIVGQKFANANPYFTVDTAKLHSYAIRISGVNKRLQTLDSNLRSLYWQVGLTDIWDILMANLLTSGSPTLNQIRDYLENAANRFETAENKSRGYIGG